MDTLAQIPLWRRPVRAALQGLFGAIPIDAETDPGDPGLCGPGSVSWQVLADTAAIVGGLRALLVQLLHPQAMAGVADHSEFRADPLGRLRRTSSYVLTATFGSASEALAASRRVRGVHQRVRGVGPDGRAYRADDPHLLAWVAVALTSSFLAADAAYGAEPVAGDAADAFVAEQARLAALLDPRVDLDALAAEPGALAALRRGERSLPMLDEGRLPTTVAELDDALAAFRPELWVGAQGREAVRFLLWPPLAPPVKAGYLPLLGGALATIDLELRVQLGARAALLGAPPAKLHARLLVATLRTLRGRSPLQQAAAARAAAPLAERAVD